jgi:hypothetical protein
MAQRMVGDHKANAPLDYPDGGIMGAILGRTLSHDVERLGFCGTGGRRPCRGISGVIRLGSNQNNAGNIAGTDFGTFFGTFCFQFGTFVPFYSQNHNLAILAAPFSSLF